MDASTSIAVAVPVLAVGVGPVGEAQCVGEAVEATLESYSNSVVPLDVDSVDDGSLGECGERHDHDEDSEHTRDLAIDPPDEDDAQQNHCQDGCDDVQLAEPVEPDALKCGEHSNDRDRPADSSDNWLLAVPALCNQQADRNDDHSSDEDAEIKRNDAQDVLSQVNHVPSSFDVNVRLI